MDIFIYALSVAAFLLKWWQSSGDRDHIAYKASDVYYLAYDKKFAVSLL